MESCLHFDILKRWTSIGTHSVIISTVHINCKLIPEKWKGRSDESQKGKEKSPLSPSIALMDFGFWSKRNERKRSSTTITSDKFSSKKATLCIYLQTRPFRHIFSPPSSWAHLFYPLEADFIFLALFVSVSSSSTATTLMCLKSSNSESVCVCSSLAAHNSDFYF